MTRMVRRMEDQLSAMLEQTIQHAEDAIEYRSSDPELARTYAEMAKTELEQARRLHDQTTRKMGELKRGETGIEVPHSIQDDWERRERSNLGKMERAKTYVDMYR